MSQVIVRRFCEAYRLVADVLDAESRGQGLADDAELTRRALGLGHQYVAQHRLRSSESVWLLLFQTALQLARNRGLSLVQRSCQPLEPPCSRPGTAPSR